MVDVKIKEIKDDVITYTYTMRVYFDKENWVTRFRSWFDIYADYSDWT